MRHIAFPLLALLIWPSGALASSVAVATPAASQDVPDGLARAIAEMARQAVADAEGFELVGSPDLSITDLQLARGCIGETAECLSPIAQDLSAEWLLIPRLDSAGGFVLTLVAFRAASGEVDRVVRRGDEESLMDGVAGQVREALGLAPVVEPDEGEDQGAFEPTDVTPPAERSEPSSGPGAGPFIVAGAGLVALGVGAALGGASLGAQSEYETTVVATVADADTARDAYDRASGLALGANVLFAVGGALLLGGVTWLLVAILGGGGDGPDEEGVAILPAASPDALGLVVRGRL